MQSRTTIYVIDLPSTQLPPPRSSMPSEAQIRSRLFRRPTPSRPDSTLKLRRADRRQVFLRTRNDLNNEIEGITRNTDFYTLSYVPGDPIQD